MAKELYQEERLFLFVFSVLGMDPEPAETHTAMSMVREIFQLVVVWCLTVLPQLLLSSQLKLGD